MAHNPDAMSSAYGVAKQHQAREVFAEAAWKWKHVLSDAEKAQYEPDRKRLKVESSIENAAQAAASRKHAPARTGSSRPSFRMGKAALSGKRIQLRRQHQVVLPPSTLPATVAGPPRRALPLRQDCKTTPVVARGRTSRSRSRKYKNTGKRGARTLSARELWPAKPPLLGWEAACTGPTASISFLQLPRRRFTRGAYWPQRTVV
ncbi:unnamed protein product [Amoebophrya sp. A120]|nr:unnamed protein product [Amoebophrya sp. A120]|eukprot:GSA120T00021531001.1